MYLAPTVLASPLATPTPSSPPPTASFLRGYYKQNCVRSKQLGPGCGAGLGAGAGTRRCYFVLAVRRVHEPSAPGSVEVELNDGNMCRNALNFSSPVQPPLLGHVPPV